MWKLFLDLLPNLDDFVAIGRALSRDPATRRRNKLQRKIFRGKKRNLRRLLKDIETKFKDNPIQEKAAIELLEADKITELEKILESG